MSEELKQAANTIHVHVVGPVGCGKSAMAGEIEILCKALGLTVSWPEGQSEKNMVGADWQHALDMYKPRVVIHEVLTQRPTAQEVEVDEQEFIPTNDFLGGHQCGLEWAAGLVEYNDPRTGDWFYDDRNDLANAIRKGPPDMPTQPAAQAMPDVPETDFGKMATPEPVHIEVVGEIVTTEDGNDVRWSIEGGADAIPEGMVLLIADRQITDDTGSGEVHTRPGEGSRSCIS